MCILFCVFFFSLLPPHSSSRMCLSLFVFGISIAFYVRHFYVFLFHSECVFQHDILVEFDLLSCSLRSSCRRRLSCPRRCSSRCCCFFLFHEDELFYSVFELLDFKHSIHGIRFIIIWFEFMFNIFFVSRCCLMIAHETNRINTDQ